MSEFENTYGLERIKANSGQHAIIVLHGIRQTREDVRNPFGERLANVATNADVYIYGYNHTRGLVENGSKLLRAIKNEISAPRIDLVGYSMGGLVARLAASEQPNPAIHTIVTLATPNRGSLSNAELTTLGQIGRSAFEFVSPLDPRAEGVKDLTRAQKIMADRRKQLVDGAATYSVARRYASIPALFYNKSRFDGELGPSVQMSVLQACLWLSGLKQRLLKMERSHDGIVTETSNKAIRLGADDWSEMDFVKGSSKDGPSRCHVSVVNCIEHDHTSILIDEQVALLVWSIIDCEDWRLLESHDPRLCNLIYVAT